MATQVGDDQCEVVLVGCGAPNRGMGWYHAEQMLRGDVPSAKLCYIIEPWFLGGGASGPGGAEFTQFKKVTEDEHGVQFYTSLADLPPVQDGKKRLALISGRTADNPRFLKECIDANCSVVYLEKPGAPSVKELEDMRDQAKEANVTVLMGYNKNVCKFVRKAREYQQEHGGHITFVSNNAYQDSAESLGECFERNAEGMLKNMAIHELALLVSFFDVSVDTIESVTADKDFSSCQTLAGPSGKEHTDFDKIKFTVKTKSGKEVSVQADRCGGDTSYAKVEDENGKEVFRHSMPDDDDLAMVKQLKEKYPDAMPYFFSQDPDYVTLKELACKFCATGAEPTGMADINIAVETLRVAEYLTPNIKEQLQ